MHMYSFGTDSIATHTGPVLMRGLGYYTPMCGAGYDSQTGVVPMTTVAALGK
jgi:hypothetical protein